MSLSKKIILILVVLIYFVPSLSFALSNNPFGGLVVFKLNCVCSNNDMIFINPPKSDLPRAVIYDRGSILYPFKKLIPGEEVLGTWEGFSPCLMPGPPYGCATPIIVPYAGKTIHPRIYMVGTSGGQVDGGGGGGSEDSACNDGRDNDGDGRTDYPDDPGCESLDDDTERETECSDGIDNDGDGRTDYPDDPGCSSASDNTEDVMGCECNCSDGKGEEETREEFANGDVQINKSPCPREDPNDECRSTSTGGGDFSCTDVRCLPQIAIDGIIELKEKVGSSCPVVITGGTEPGHETHRQCKAIVDLRIGNACLDNYIKENGSVLERDPGLGTWYLLETLSVGPVRFLDENRKGYVRHWHVVFDGERTPADECLIKKYIIANEGWINEVYWDLVETDKLVYGVGHLVTPGEGYSRGDYVSDEEIKNVFESDFSSHYSDAKQISAEKGVDFDSLSEGRQIALTDMTFQMRYRVRGFNKMWTAIRNENWQEAGREVTDSEYGGQTPNRANRARRLMESGSTDVAESHVESVKEARNYNCGA